MELLLKRSQCGAKTTVGELTINGKHECWIIEDADRQLEDNPDAKVPGETCIPRGTYQILITWSNRFNRDLPLLMDVPGYSGVRIHPGNSSLDTEGCLLPCTSYVPDNKLGNIGLNSRAAFNVLLEKIDEALSRKESVEIEIV